MRLLVFLSGLAYAGLTLLSALLVWLGGALDCYESCDYDHPNAHWSDRADAWQWDVLLWLGPTAAVAGVCALVLLAALRREGWFLLGLHAAVLAVAGGISVDEGDLDWPEVILWCTSILGVGVAFGFARRRVASGPRT